MTGSGLVQNTANAQSAMPGSVSRALPQHYLPHTQASLVHLRPVAC